MTWRSLSIYCFGYLLNCDFPALHLIVKEFVFRLLRWILSIDPKFPATGSARVKDPLHNDRRLREHHPEGSFSSRYFGRR